MNSATDGRPSPPPPTSAQVRGGHRGQPGGVRPRHRGARDRQRRQRHRRGASATPPSPAAVHQTVGRSEASRSPTRVLPGRRGLRPRRQRPWKALRRRSTSTTLSDGDLLIAGWARTLTSTARDEAFIDGARSTAASRRSSTARRRSATTTSTTTCSARARRVRVPGRACASSRAWTTSPESSPLRHLYEQVGRRARSTDCPSAASSTRDDRRRSGRIADIDLTEWSITGVPVGRNQLRRRRTEGA